MLSSCCQLTGMEQSNPRSELSFPGILIPSPKHPFAMSAGKVTFFFSWKPAFWGGRTFPVSCQHREGRAVVQLEEKKEKKAFRSSTPAPQHTALRSHLAVCQAASIIPSSTAKWHFSQKKAYHLREERHCQYRWMLHAGNKSCSRSFWNMCCTHIDVSWSEGLQKFVV